MSSTPPVLDTSILAELKGELSPEQYARIVGLVRDAAAREYRRGTVDGYMDGQKKAPPEPRPLVSDETLRALRGALKSTTIRIGALVSAASALLLRDDVQQLILTHVGPSAYPYMGMAVGLIMIVRRIQTTTSISERGSTTQS